MEANPGDAIKNNVLGTRTVADAARDCRCDAFVLVSTDKAVNPSSVMGATKRVAELYVQSLNQCGTGILPVSPGCEPDRHGQDARATRFLTVRFGNVLGSSGSVVPIFQRQIEAGGPVTVTHPEMMRYFMTTSEASQLVMQAGAIGRGGEIFVLDMGSPVRILDLARELIRRNGLRAGRDIEIRISGVRPGEKLHEELAGAGEQTRPTMHPKIRVWELPPADGAQVSGALELLSRAAGGSRDEAVEALRACVPEYLPSERADQRADESAASLGRARALPRCAAA